MPVYPGRHIAYGWMPNVSVDPAILTQGFLTAARKARKAAAEESRAEPSDNFLSAARAGRLTCIRRGQGLQRVPAL